MGKLRTSVITSVQIRSFKTGEEETKIPQLAAEEREALTQDLEVES